MIAIAYLNLQSLANTGLDLPLMLLRPALPGLLTLSAARICANSSIETMELLSKQRNS